MILHHSDHVQTTNVDFHQIIMIPYVPEIVMASVIGKIGKKWLKLKRSLCLQYIVLFFYEINKKHN